MTTDPAASVPNPVQHRDAEVLIGILAVLEGAIWAGSFGEQTAGAVAERFAQGACWLPAMTSVTCVRRWRT
jgi:hypothetical protein